LSAQQPPREDTSKNQVSGGGHDPAAKALTKKPKHQNDRKRASLADRRERNERPLYVRLPRDDAS
jgi:hypothetical protein